MKVKAPRPASSLPRRSAAFAFLLASLSPALAQLAAPDAADTADDQVVTLTEFTVTASAASEYMASESLTGTRVASRIQELPFAVNVVTSDFLDDFLALEWSESLGYVSNVGQSEVQSPGYTLRGFEADVQLRNGFRRIGLIDKVAIDRTEVIKGPAASIYGTVLPGGIVNVITKKPLARPEHRLSVTAGDYDLLRAQASSTGPVGNSKSAFYRVDLSADQRTYETRFKEKRTEAASLQFLFKLAPQTSLLIEGEYLSRREDGNTTQTIPFIVESVRNPWRASGNYNRYVALADDELFDFSTQGPDTYSYRWVKNLSATLEHRINRTWALRASANWFDRDLDRNEVGGRDQFNPVTRRVQRGTGRYRQFPEGGGGAQVDLLGQFETGSIKHRLLVTLDYQRQTEAPYQYDAATNDAFPTSVASGLSVDDPDYRFISYLEDPSLYTLVSSSKGEIDIYGLFISERMSFFNDRLITLTGVRFDSAERNNLDRRTGNRQEISTDDVTYQLGANYRLFPGIILYANHSTSFVPPFGTGSRADGSTFVLPNEEGSGFETGVKFAVLDERLTFTAGYFDIERRNIARSTFDSATGNPVTIISGREVSRGFEIDFNFVATRSLQFFGGYGHVNAYVAENEERRWLEGVPLRRSPKDNLGLGAKYEIKDGSFKGLYFTAGLKAYGRSIANTGNGQNITSVSNSNPFINLRYPNGRLPFPEFEEGALITSLPHAISVPNNRENVYNAAYHVVDVGIGYKWRSDRFRHKLQLNLKNIGNERYTYGSSAPGDLRNFAVTYDLTF
jgi:Outer membrane receptor for monomeric catechols